MKLADFGQLGLVGGTLVAEAGVYSAPEVLRKVAVWGLRATGRVTGMAVSREGQQRAAGIGRERRNERGGQWCRGWRGGGFPLRRRRLALSLIDARSVPRGNRRAAGARRTCGRWAAASWRWGRAPPPPALGCSPPPPLMLTPLCIMRLLPSGKKGSVSKERSLQLV